MASILEGMPCRVTIKEYNKEEKCWRTNIYEGTFLDFSTDYEEFESGPGQYPVGIILLESGQLASVPVSNIEILSGEEDDEHSETMGDTKDPNDSVHI